MFCSRTPSPSKIEERELQTIQTINKQVRDTQAQVSHLPQVQQPQCPVYQMPLQQLPLQPQQLPQVIYDSPTYYTYQQPIELPVHPPQVVYYYPPIQPMQPMQPMQPIQPMQPMQPIQPMQPMQPIQPIQPIQPMQPIQPIQPMQPIQPIQPIQPMQPIQPIQPTYYTPMPVAQQQITPAAVQPQEQANEPKQEESSKPDNPKEFLDVPKLQQMLHATFYEVLLQVMKQVDPQLIYHVLPQVYNQVLQEVLTQTLPYIVTQSYKTEQLM